MNNNFNKHKKQKRPEAPAPKDCKNKYPIHWISKTFMSLPDDVFIDLFNRIKESGQTQPVLIWVDPKTKKEWIVDGNHRQQIANILGVKLKTTKINPVPEKDLPLVVLDTQLTGRGNDKIYCNCEAIDTLETMKKMGIKMTASALSKKYPSVLNANRMSRLKTIKRLRPVWFEKLKLGLQVEITNELGRFYSRNVEAVARMCLDEEKSIDVEMTKQKNLPDKDLYAVQEKQLNPFCKLYLDPCIKNMTTTVGIPQEDILDYLEAILETAGRADNLEKYKFQKK
jgi:ParB/Sulfiredoxin domain